MPLTSQEETNQLKQLLKEELTIKLNSAKDLLESNLAEIKRCTDLVEMYKLELVKYEKAIQKSQSLMQVEKDEKVSAALEKGILLMQDKLEHIKKELDINSAYARPDSVKFRNYIDSWLGVGDRRGRTPSELRAEIAEYEKALQDLNS